MARFSVGQEALLMTLVIILSQEEGKQYHAMDGCTQSLGLTLGILLIYKKQKQYESSIGIITLKS